MTKHRKFHADRFLDKFQGREDLLRAFVRLWHGRLSLDAQTMDVPAFREFLLNGDGEAKDQLVEELHRVFDLCTERGHEDLVAAYRDAAGEDPDPSGDLHVECLSLKLRTEQEEAFNLAYDRNTLWQADRFTIYGGSETKAISDPAAAAARLKDKLSEVFKDDKKSDRVLVRQYREGARTNFIVYHEKRSKAELVFRGTKARPNVSPTILRPAQQDFISYDHETGQVEIEARFQNEEATLRKSFAECCLGAADLFEGPDAANRIDLDKIAEDGFEMRVDTEAKHSAALVELHVGLKQKHGPSLVVRSKDALDTLELNHLRKRLSGIRRAVFKITFPDDMRGKRVEVAGTNSVRFKRATHADEVFAYLRAWKIVLG